MSIATSSLRRSILIAVEGDRFAWHRRRAARHLAGAVDVRGDVSRSPHQTPSAECAAHEIDGHRRRLERADLAAAAVHENVRMCRLIVEILDGDAEGFAVVRVVELHALGGAAGDLLVVVVGRAWIGAAPETDEAGETWRAAAVERRVGVAPIDAIE